MTREPMTTPEETPEESAPVGFDELARKREERASAGEPEDLKARVREDARRTARRMAAAERARRRSGPPVVPPPDGSSGGASGAA